MSGHGLDEPPADHVPETAFKDHFSGHATGYAAARPGYPPALFDWLATQAPAQGLAWDAGCGNGQAALGLAAHFDRVVATDPSAAQIAAATAHPRIDYRVEPAELPTLDDASVDLVVVAQAMHWFDLPRFHAAVRRVLRPGGVIAAWCYELTRVSPAVDAVFSRLYDDVLGAYWPAERRHVESGYRDLPFPYQSLPTPSFELCCRWTLPRYLDYLRSWSATQRYLRTEGQDPVTAMSDAFAEAWGTPTRSRDVRWPLSLRVGALR